MTVFELIQELTMYPPDMAVVTDGYESGYGDVEIVEIIRITNEKVNDHWWDGDYSADANGREAFYISRYKDSLK